MTKPPETGVFYRATVLGFQLQFDLPAGVPGRVSFVTRVSTNPSGSGSDSIYYDVTVIAPLIAMAFIQ